CRRGLNAQGLSTSPASARIPWADVNRRIIKICPHGRGFLLPPTPVWFRLRRLRIRTNLHAGRFLLSDSRQALIPLSAALISGTDSFALRGSVTIRQFASKVWRLNASRIFAATGPCI